MPHAVELEENVAVKPKGWNFDDDAKFPFEHLDGPGKAFFLPFEYNDETTEDEFKAMEASLKRHIYARAKIANTKVEIRRGKNADGIKGVRVHYKAPK